MNNLLCPVAAERYPTSIFFSGVAVWLYAAAINDTANTSMDWNVLFMVVFSFFDVCVCNLTAAMCPIAWKPSDCYLQFASFHGEAVFAHGVQHGVDIGEGGLDRK